VIDKHNNNFFWLMWYDSNGIPELPMSTVFGKDDFGEMVKLLTTFI